MKKRILIILALVIVITGIGVGVLFANKPNFLFPAEKTDSTITTTTTTEIKNITYKGQDGVTALALLQQNADIKTSGTGENAFVTSINGVEADSSSQYWAFYVNGTAATVGAGSYITKNSDTITWELTTF